VVGEHEGQITGGAAGGVGEQRHRRVGVDEVDLLVADDPADRSDPSGTQRCLGHPGPDGQPIDPETVGPGVHPGRCVLGSCGDDDDSVAVPGSQHPAQVGHVLLHPAQVRRVVRGGQQDRWHERAGHALCTAVRLSRSDGIAAASLDSG
jgi:hypothetical protein